MKYDVWFCHCGTIQLMPTEYCDWLAERILQIGISLGVSALWYSSEGVPDEDEEWVFYLCL